MEENEINANLEMTSEVFKKKADRILSVIKNINFQGGITTQLMMAAACIETQYFESYLVSLYNEGVIDRNVSPDLAKLEEYIRLFKNARKDLGDNLNEGRDHTLQRDEDLKIISYLKDLIMEDFFRHVNDNDYEYLDSWECLQTDIDMLYDLLYDQIRNIILGFESIYQIIRESKAETQVNTNTKKKIPRNNFREFVKDKKKTDEIIKRLHSLIGNKKNTAAADIIKEAMWLELIYRPTIPSIKEEFPSITCSTTPLSKKLKEGETLPKKGGNVDYGLLDKIREKFEQ